MQNLENYMMKMNSNSNDNMKYYIAGGVALVVIIILIIVLSSRSKDNIMRGKCFWGTGEVSSFRDLTEQECLNKCKSENECSGMTYNPRKEDGRSSCWLRKGDADFTSCLGTDVAYKK